MKSSGADDQRSKYDNESSCVLTNLEGCRIAVLQYVVMFRWGFEKFALHYE